MCLPRSSSTCSSIAGARLSFLCSHLKVWWCRCDNITISPPLLGELDKSTDPLPRKLWPEMGGCDEPKARTKPLTAYQDPGLAGENSVPCIAFHGVATSLAQLLPQAEQALLNAVTAKACAQVDMTAGAYDTFAKMHGEDQMAVDKLREGIEGFSKDQKKLEALVHDLVPQVV